MSMGLEEKAEEGAEEAVRGTSVYGVSYLFHVVKVLSKPYEKFHQETFQCFPQTNILV